MPASSREPGRALLYVILAVVVAAVVGLIVAADPFGTGDAIERGDVAEETGDLRIEGAGADAVADLDVEGGGLAGRYGEGDLGAVRLRVLSVSDRLPIADLGVRLIPRTGGGRETTSDGGGVAVFTSVAPSRGYRVEITGANLAHVSIQGVNVRRGETTDLGDIVLGANVVLRGRVIDGTGRPLPGTSVSVYTPGRSVISDGFIFNMVEQATNFPAPVEQVLTDDEGWFTLVSLTGGSYRLEARQGGYATRYETDVVVSEERPARDMTIVLGEGATVAGKVVDEVGKPIAGARVVALKDMGRRFFGCRHPRARRRAHGRRRLVRARHADARHDLPLRRDRRGLRADLRDVRRRADGQGAEEGLPARPGRLDRRARPAQGQRRADRGGTGRGGRGPDVRRPARRRRRGAEGGHGPRDHRRGRHLPHREPHARARHVGAGEVLRATSPSRRPCGPATAGPTWSPAARSEVLVELEPGGSVGGTVTDATTNAADPLRRGDGAAARQPHARHVHRQPVRPGGRRRAGSRSRACSRASTA